MGPTRDLNLDERCHNCLKDNLRLTGESVGGLQARVAELEAALKEAIDLRVSIYRHSDFDGDTDSMTNDQVALMDPFAKKWVALITR